jgi:uncharacterized protein (DUF983 family)
MTQNTAVVDIISQIPIWAVALIILMLTTLVIYLLSKIKESKQ